MRKDKGMSTDIERLPALTWIMFLKFLDDMEMTRETEAKVEGKRFKADIGQPYRWRDWAGKDSGLTGDDLIAFINHQEATRPDGGKGFGLLAYLRSLEGANGGDRRDIIANVFRGLHNPITNGYLLRDVTNKITGIHFNSTEEIHTLSHLYETILKELRDAAGTNGEFYTPRPVIRFMVEVANPSLGETLLDPACGTGGFLVEAFKYLEMECKTVADRKILQRKTLFGTDPKPLPFLLVQMNLLLHGLEYPQISKDNSLGVKLSEIGEKDRVDIVLTNPPFGGEEERGILGNFPKDTQTDETALLFLQLIMRKLRRNPAGRAAVIVPNGVLFGDGVCARIKGKLLQEFNLHTIVRLPNGVFAPYTGIPTNILFFEYGGPTKEIWFYEHPLPEGRKTYTKTKPLQFDEFAPCLDWWKKRKKTNQAWKIKAKDVLKFDEDGGVLSANLDIKNPNAAPNYEHMPPEQLIEDILQKEQKIIELISELKQSLRASDDKMATDSTR